MAKLAPEEVCMWVPQAYCAAAFARPGSVPKTKLSLTMRGWLECSNSIAEETQTVQKLEKAAVEFLKEDAGEAQKRMAKEEFCKHCPLTPLHLTTLGKGTLVEVQYLTEALLLAMGAAADDEFVDISDDAGGDK